MTQRPLVIVLALVSFAGILTVFSVVPLVAVIAADLDVSVPVVGQSFTVASIVGAALALIIGPAGDHYGQRRLLVAATLLAGTGTLAGALAPDFWTFVLTRVVAGLGGGAMGALALAVASSRLPEAERRVAFGWIITGLSLAPIAGMPIMTEIGERLDWRASLGVLSTLSLVGVVAQLTLIPGDRPWPSDRLKLSGAIDAYARIMKDTTSVLLQVSNLLRATAVFSVSAYLAGYLMAEVGVSLQFVGYVFMVGGFGYLVGSRIGDGTIIPLPLRAFYACSTVVFGVALATPLILGLGLVPTTILFIVANAGVGAGFVALNILIVEETPGGSSTALVLRQSGFSVGAAIGGAMGGGLLALGGFPILAVASLSIAVLAAAAGYWKPAPAPQVQMSESS